jgi:hypothetical protein
MKTRWDLHQLLSSDQYIFFVFKQIEEGSFISRDKKIGSAPD